MIFRKNFNITHHSRKFRIHRYVGECLDEIPDQGYFVIEIV